LSAKANVDHQDLAALAASKAVTAVDVFVYDTSKDSDGGAWRKRCSKLSWYNEPLNTATRGARREFPSVAVIVAEAGKVTIYDGDDPALPMWMVFNIGQTGSTYTFLIGVTVTCIAAVNATLVLGRGFSLNALNFISEERNYSGSAGVFTWGSSPISERNNLVNVSLVAGRILPALLVSPATNDVAMTVLPGAPIDPVTGLPIPTIAVATGGGVSVIKSDGTVTNPFTVYAMHRVHFSEDALYYCQTGDHQLRRVPAPNFTTGTTADFYSWRDNEVKPSISPRTSFSGFGNIISDGKSIIAASPAVTVNLAFLQETLGNAGNSMVAYATASHATGWLPGAIRGAWLADTDAASLTGVTPLSASFTGTGNLDGFTLFTQAINNNGVDELDITTGPTSNVAVERYLSGLTIGADYVIEFERKLSVNPMAVRLGDTFSPYESTVGVARFTAQATSSTMRIQVLTGGANQRAVLDNVSIKLADADRSANNKGLIVNGTITRTPVATGAELVAYSGFSGANFLEQPYNAGLDFGTGDFCVMGWANPAGDNQAIISYENDTAGHAWTIGRSTGLLRLFTGRGVANKAYSFGALNSGAWQFFCVYRKAGHWFGGVSGEMALTGIIGANDVFVTDSVLRVGKQTLISGAAWAGSIAMIRASATIPTADQIRKIYEDEKVLFQENAACTLYGTSDAVTALAHDPDTGLLHVGTSQGRSVFKGLRRVDNTTVAVGTAISAVNGMVVEE
jgi:hypothetical protein